MMDAAKQKAFDVLVVDDSSRLSRDTADALRALSVLDFYGIKFIGRTDGIDTTQNGSRLLFGIKAAMSEEFLRDLADKTHRGLEGRARRGYSAGGLPYGYRSEPVTGERGEIIGYMKTMHEAEAAIVRRIFRLYVGDEALGPLSPRAIAHLLNAEGIAPPGARWRNRTAREAHTWSHTAILGHRRLGKGILSNPLYIGRALWNRSEWVRHPLTKRYTYRVRPKDDWIEFEVPALRIVPQDLWDRAQARLALHTRITGGQARRVQAYLLSGFVRCGVCGATYTLRSRHAYGCTMNNSRGEVACPNRLRASRKRLERLVVAAIRDRLYTPANIAPLLDRVRTALVERARREQHACRQDDQAKALRRLDAEIEHLLHAVETGKATPLLLERLEEKHRRRGALLADVPDAIGDLETKLARLLARLPEKIAQAVADLETLLASHQVARGKDILAALGTEIVLTPTAAGLEAEIRGSLRQAVTLAGGSIPWLGEEDSNPH
jgi:site-specific DNA recombinase